MPWIEINPPEWNSNDENVLIKPNLTETHNIEFKPMYVQTSSMDEMNMLIFNRKLDT